jgi:hypothetical protein
MSTIPVHCQHMLIIILMRDKSNKNQAYRGTGQERPFHEGSRTKTIKKGGTLTGHYPDRAAAGLSPPRSTKTLALAGVEFGLRAYRPLAQTP